MLSFLYRKMVKNKWLVLSLLAGFIIATSIITSVPMYTSAIFKKILATDLQTLQTKDQIYPGNFVATKALTPKEIITPKNPSISKAIESAGSSLATKIDMVVDSLGMPVMSKKTEFTCESISVSNYGEDNKTKDERGGNIKVNYMSDIENNVTFKEGTGFSSSTDDYMEAIISETTRRTYNLKVGQCYALRKASSQKYAKIKVVGIFDVDDKENAFWSDGNIMQADKIFINYDSMMRLLEDSEVFYINSLSWTYHLDYSNINVNSLSKVISTLEDSQKNLLDSKNGGSIHLAALETFKNYVPKTKQLSITLWTIQAPVILMIIIYIFMVSSLILEHDESEVSVLRSRGASRFQVLKVYLGENLILFLITVLVSPFVSYIITKALGATSGFLKFVDRPALDISITKTEWLYALVSGFVFLLIMFIPIALSPKDSIVAQKRARSRKNKPFWKRFYLDFILLGIGIYSVYQFKSFESIVNVSKMDTGNLPISPFMYGSFTLLILGIGLVALRIYPYVVKLLFKVGRGSWKPSLYVCLTNITRGRNKDGFLMIFLILTLSTGIFNLKAASTINTMAENKIKYLSGSDMVVRPWWMSANSSAKDSTTESKAPEGAGGPAGNFYKDIDFTPYTKLDGVESVTRVLRTRNGRINYNGSFSNEKMQVIGVIPDEFGKTAWFDPSLLPYHWYNYLNLIAQEPKAVLISSEIAKDLNLSKGSRIDLRFDETLYLECYVGEIISYWPGYDPNASFGSGFVVMNLNYIESMCATQPYEIWMKKKEDATYAQVFDSIKANSISYENLHLSYNDLVNSRTSPIIQGTNGMLSLSFIASMIITTLGFLIYWTLSIKNRTLDFGILRAMGLSMKKIINILIDEQCFISGVAILMGALIGGFISNVFVPMLNLSTDPSQKVILPFKPVSFAGGYIKLGVFLFIILFISLLILINIVKKININQALKLGED